MTVTTPPDEAPQVVEELAVDEPAAPRPVLAGLVVLGAEDAPACSDGFCV
ncbi:hypothetical protein WEI85_06425 [Actinomycetes bacterium KLBMP 9797]